MDYLKILESLSIISASLVAIFGINSWKNELKWKRNNELAEEILALCYENKSNLDFIRNPIMTGAEGLSRPIPPGEDPKITPYLNRAYVFYERYELKRQIFDLLKSKKFNAMARFEKEIGDQIKIFEDVKNSILWHAGNLGKIYWPKQDDRTFGTDELQKTRGIIAKSEEIIWKVNEEDATSIIINQAIEKIEMILMKWIK